MRVLPSLVVTWKDRAWPLRLELLCQFWPQFLDIACHPVFDPLIETEWTSPAPATFVTRTRLKYECPLIVNLIPPFLWQGTLSHPIKHSYINKFVSEMPLGLIHSKKCLNYYKMTLDVIYKKFIIFVHL